MSALLSPEDLKRQALANVQHVVESAEDAASTANPALTALRDNSLAALKAVVFPGRKTEQWKYTSLQPLADGHLNQRHSRRHPGGPAQAGRLPPGAGQRPAG